MIDILVFSHACLKRVNRLVFNQLNKEYGYTIKIVAPSVLNVEGMSQKHDKVLNGDVDVIFKALTKSNPRVYQFEETEKILNQYNPKVIYLDNDPVSLQAIKIGKWAKKNNSKLICLSCENLSFGMSESLKRLGLRGIPTSIFKNILTLFSKKLVSHVFTINSAGNGLFKALGFKSVSMIVLGFDPNIFNPDRKKRENGRNQLDISENMVVISYIGRMVPEKGVHHLINSLTYLKDNSNWILLLDKFSNQITPYQEEIIQLIKSAEIEDKVRYFEADHSEVATFMNAADVVVLPSVSTKKWVEQYGRVAPEAMACGKIVIVSNSGALPDLVQTHGIITEEADEISLGSKLKSIVEDFEDYQKIGLEAAEYARKNLSTNKQAAQIDTILKKLSTLN
ncbi:MAG: glycosyltransferase family 4 protein [Flavobacteriales bacterium]|nr:glycosyltransferase family 4 protein [Flavobacteriales bacterium]